MFKGAGGSQGDLNGFLDAGSHMQGDLRFEDTFRIDGKFTGKIQADGDLIVGEGGEVEAEVKVRRAFVSGSLKGRVEASARVEVTSTGKVVADLSTPSLSIEDGAFFEGHCSMDRKKSKVTQMPLAKKG